jgi:chromosome segregation ATPase
MDIAKLLKRQDALVAEMEKAVAAAGVPAGALSRPVEIQEARAERIKERIAALEEAKSDHARQVDLEISDLKDELKGLDARIRADRDRLASALKTPKAPPAKASAPAKVRPKRQPK